MSKEYIERKLYSKTLKDLIADSDNHTNYEKGYIQGLPHEMYHRDCGGRLE